jgi:hypothetical protein
MCSPESANAREEDLERNLGTVCVQIQCCHPVIGCSIGAQRNDCQMFCVQHLARTEMYRSVHCVSWASRRDNGRSNFQSAARLHVRTLGGCTRLPPKTPSVSDLQRAEFRNVSGLHQGPSTDATITMKGRRAFSTIFRVLYRARSIQEEVNDVIRAL